MLFSKLPPIFMLSFDTKSNVKVVEQMKIDDRVYNLSACAMHFGNQHDGHYVTYIRRKTNWYFINDERVEEKSPPSEGSYYFMVYSS